MGVWRHRLLPKEALMGGLKDLCSQFPPVDFANIERSIQIVVVQIQSTEGFDSQSSDQHSDLHCTAHHVTMKHLQLLAVLLVAVLLAVVAAESSAKARIPDSAYASLYLDQQTGAYTVKLHTRDSQGTLCMKRDRFTFNTGTLLT